MNKITRTIRLLRLQHDYKQAYVAMKLKKSQAAYSKMERGFIRISEDSLNILAQVYGTTPEHIRNADPDMVLIPVRSA